MKFLQELNEMNQAGLEKKIRKGKRVIFDDLFATVLDTRKQTALHTTYLEVQVKVDDEDEPRWIDSAIIDKVL